MNAFRMCFIVGLVGLRSSVASGPPMGSEPPKLASRRFQVEFLEDMTRNLDRVAKGYLNEFLLELHAQEQTAKVLAEALQMAKDCDSVEQKIVFIRQWLDTEKDQSAKRGNAFLLRNLSFLEKIKGKLRSLVEESTQELHQLRYYYLCQQLQLKPDIPPSNVSEPSSAHQADGAGGQLDSDIAVNLTEFGRTLYDHVKLTGSEIINDYLAIIRKLLQEVVDEKSEVSSSEALTRIIAEIDRVLNTQDFYAKRQRVYDYLENALALDFEQFQTSDDSRHDLNEVFMKLKTKGLDLLIVYLFSNLEFLELLHDQWAVQLPPAPVASSDKDTQLLRHIQRSYREFKRNFGNSSHYDDYLSAVRQLYEVTQRDGSDQSHVYELLYSASQNMGSVRADIIYTKCNEI